MKTLKQNSALFFVLAMMLSIVVTSCSKDDEETILDPTAAFTFAVDTDNSLMVAFTSTTTDAVSVAWNFGDGNTSDEENPTHTYAEGGDYTVTLTVTGKEGTTAAQASETVTVSLPYAKIEGIIFGHEGSWDGVNGLIDAAFDGDLSTYVDAPGSEANTGHVGYDFGEGNLAVLAMIKYAPRPEWTARMVNAEIRGSNDPTLTDYVVLHTITEEPPVGEMTTAMVNATEGYRYIYYYTSNDGYCNVSELEFYGELNP